MLELILDGVVVATAAVRRTWRARRVRWEWRRRACGDCGGGMRRAGVRILREGGEEMVLVSCPHCGATVEAG